MKTLLLLLGLAWPLALVAAAPPVAFTIDPTEPIDGHVVFARIAATSGSARESAKLWFGLSISNTSAGIIRVTNIQARLSDGSVWNFAQSADIQGRQTRTLELAENQLIALPLPVPPVLTIGVYCQNYSDPSTLERLLLPYSPETPGNRYLFPADEGDLGPEEYFAPENIHMPPEDQRWGVDWSVRRIDDEGNVSRLREDTDGSRNEHHLGFGIPIRAVAEGVVLRVYDGAMDSPVTETRSFQQLDSFDGEAIGDVKVAFLGQLTNARQEFRFAVLTRRPDSRFTVTLWDLASNGRQMIQRRSFTSEVTVSDFAIGALSSTRFVVSARLAGSNTHQLSLFNVEDAPEGQPEILDTLERDPVNTELALAPLAGNLFASCVRDSVGNLIVEIYEVNSADDLIYKDQRSAGRASSIAATALDVSPDDTRRFVCSMRDSAGFLRVIVWDWRADSGVLFRRGAAVGPAISRLAATDSEGGKWITAARTSSGVLHLARWSASASGVVQDPEMVTTTTNAIGDTALAAVHSTGNTTGRLHLTTASVLDGLLKINGWGDHSDKGRTNFNADAQSTETTFPVTHLSLDEGAKAVFLVGARTAAGNLKLTSWFWAQGGGNFVIIRHGKCRFSYNHFKLGSVFESGLQAGDVVGAGQFIGRMGNTGSAGTPHTHIHADRLHDDYADGQRDAELIALEREFDYTGDRSLIPRLTARPIPFSNARARLLKDIVLGGEAANPFATLTDHGILDASLGIRPRLNTRYLDPLANGDFPNGRKEVVPGLTPLGGPYHGTVGQAAGDSLEGSSLYVRGGDYPETLTLRKPITLRRYDYYSREPLNAGSVIIGSGVRP